MSCRYLVDSLSQPTWWTCFHTCLVMLDRYRTRHYPSRYPSELESMLFPGAKHARAQIDPRANEYLLGKASMRRAIAFEVERRFGKGKLPSGLLTPMRARMLAERLGYRCTAIADEPNMFERVLQRHGPFIWVGNLNHTVLVTGIERRTSLSTVYFNDPAGGRRRALEFYKFLLELRPSLKRLESTKDAIEKIEVFHLKN